ncbi:hypothetical protein C7N43_03605 [Sphingobacteriales bacterium UPWRP_1]|nr:hypothetical protein BVG80_08015 [Sphingobacteriales bacterium TSM_CSM]PSJ78429.1 hypothetical protein C7N43_03605 [Sphingobacteriales bacterium UPWRP_1]
MVISSGIYPAPAGNAELPRGALLVKVQSVFNAGSQTVWQKLQQPATLQFIASPLLQFTPQNHAALPANWQEGTFVKLRLHAFGVLPLGKHCITVNHINHQTLTLQTTESGTMAPV